MPPAPHLDIKWCTPYLNVFLMVVLNVVSKFKNFWKHFELFELVVCSRLPRGKYWGMVWYHIKFERVLYEFVMERFQHRENAIATQHVCKVKDVHCFSTCTVCQLDFFCCHPESFRFWFQSMDFRSQDAIRNLKLPSWRHHLTSDTL